MKDRVPRLPIVCTVLCALILICGSALRAEVSVGIEPNSGRVLSLGAIEAITDDPEPVPNVWQRYHEPSPAIVPLNPEGQVNGDGRASAVIHPLTGEALVAWAKNNPTGFDIVLSRFAGGSWLAPVPISDGPENEVDPVLLVGPGDGQLHLIYWIDDASPRVMYRSAPPDASSWSAPLQVSAPGERARRPDAVFHQGQLHVAHEAVGVGYPVSPRLIVVALFDGEEFQSSPPSVVSQTYYNPDNWPRVHARGNRLWVDWIDASGELAWSEWTPVGWQYVDIEPYTTSFDLEFHARGRIAARVLSSN